MIILISKGRLILARIDRQVASGIAGDGAVVVQLINADAVGRVLDITPIGVYAREDIPGRAAAKVKNRHYGVLAVRAAL